MKEVDQLMETVEVKWEFTESEWQKQILWFLSTREIMQLDEIFQNQFSKKREKRIFLTRVEDQKQWADKSENGFWMGRSEANSNRNNN